MTNTDESDFAQRHPSDSELFSNLLLGHRPEWELSVYSAKDGDFPDSVSEFDGLIITGSPASVHDGDRWISELLDVIRTAFTKNVPIFGACFGHQAVALALGGEVGGNPGGWMFGLTGSQIVARRDWTEHLDDQIFQFSANCEQVTKAPDGAKIIATSAACPIACLAIGNDVFTTQHHPEMTLEFMAALIDEYGDELGPDVTDAARASLSRQPCTEAFAQSIIQFFEAAR